MEVVSGSLTSEVQRVSLRSEGISSNGTFRIEVTDGSTDVSARNRVDANHDGTYWTSELTANATSEEVRDLTKTHRRTRIAGRFRHFQTLEAFFTRMLPKATHNIETVHVPCDTHAKQVAEALHLLPNVGYVQVVKLNDGVNRTYGVVTNDSSSNTTTWTNSTANLYMLWEWEVTFVTDPGDRPLMAAVWSTGRTAPAADEEKESTGRATRRTCGSCKPFPEIYWTSSAEAAVGAVMKVS